MTSYVCDLCWNYSKLGGKSCLSNIVSEFFENVSPGLFNYFSLLFTENKKKHHQNTVHGGQKCKHCDKNFQLVHNLKSILQLWDTYHKYFISTWGWENSKFLILKQRIQTVWLFEESKQWKTNWKTWKKSFRKITMKNWWYLWCLMLFFACPECPKSSQNMNDLERH